MSKYLKRNNRLPVVLMIIIYILSIIVTIMVTTVTQRSKYETLIDELTIQHEAELESLRDELYSNYVSQMAELKQYYEYGGDVDQIELEAEYIAKVIYGTAKDHSESDQRAVVWCVLNRVEHHSHPDTVAEVCEQPKQWMGYSSDNPVLTDIFDLALAELKIWYGDGHRPMSNEYIYLSWSSKEIILRDTFKETKNTNYWRMK